MYCKHCNQRLKVTRDIDKPSWTVSCDCATGKHPWLEIAERKCIVAAFQKNEEAQA